MPTPSHDARLTYDDFLLLPDDGLRHEIIDGEHYVTPSPNQRHQELVGRLCLSLGTFLEDRPERGRVFLSPFDVVFSFHDVVEPDLVFVAPDQLDILTAQNIQGTPALVIEILSPSTRKRDQEIKRLLYERTGVREYWLVDPELASVTLYRRAADGAFSMAADLDRRWARHARDAARAWVVVGPPPPIPLSGGGRRGRSALPGLDLLGDPLDLGHHAQQVAAPQLGDLLLGVAARTSSSVTLKVSSAPFHPSTPPPPSKSDEMPTWSMPIIFTR